MTSREIHVICSLHFTPDCFRYSIVKGKRFLKEGSCPSINLENKQEKDCNTKTVVLEGTPSVSTLIDEKSEIPSNRKR